ncbi:MAG: hypothetical protein HYV35_10020 [Lentisphaerae bacterium]|nr:hypothetical protein [Lentisphaerota bacterium]
MTILRASISVILMALAAYIVVMNWGCVIASERNKRKGIAKHHSTVPLISLILTGVIAYPLYPFSPKWWIGIIPAVDIGNWMLVIGLPWAIARGMFKKEDTPNQSVDGTR